MNRKDWSFMKVAQVLSGLSTCSRRAVGCVLLDQNYLIVGSGYNGVPKGVEHCNSWHPGCPMKDDLHGSICWAIHAEQNAIRQCQNVESIYTVVTTSFPCFACFKMIANTGAKRICYDANYPADQDLVYALNEKLPEPIEFIRIEIRRD